MAANHFNTYIKLCENFSAGSKKYKWGTHRQHAISYAYFLSSKLEVCSGLY
jgi:hypothetical protein